MPAPRGRRHRFSPLGAMQQRIVDTLVAARGRTVPVRELVEAVYGHDPNGGPEGALNSLRVQIWKLRTRRGFAILNRYGSGYLLRPGGSLLHAQ